MSDQGSRTVIDKLRARLTYANVTASLALFIALGGTSYAAITLPRNSVGNDQIRTGAVRSSEVRNGSLQASDMSARARRALAGRPGPQGPAGPQGAAGVNLFAAVDASGRLVRGNATSGGRASTGVYEVGFSRAASGCRLQRDDRDDGRLYRWTEPDYGARRRWSCWGADLRRRRQPGGPAVPSPSRLLKSREEIDRDRASRRAKGWRISSSLAERGDLASRSAWAAASVRKEAAAV